jgi:histidinol dehydrogenase
MLTKRLQELSDEDLTKLFSRQVGIQDVLPQVGEILAQVAEMGDKALLEYTEKFDGIKLSSIRVTHEELEEAYDSVSEELLKSLAQAAENIFAFHSEQLGHDLWLTEIEPGVTVGQKIVPLDSVGAYVPGGRAAYPSSALMTVIPAEVAGVPRIVVCTPPGKDGKINPLTLVAADTAGADEIYKVGGVQAIAAMAFGTESVGKVTKIVGPGNTYVTAAKLLIRDVAEIDFPAGPSEVLIIADRSADPGVIASDMVAQMEHDPDSIAVAVLLDDLLASAVAEEVQLQTRATARCEIAGKCMEKSAILLADDLGSAVDFSNAFAPEHLEIMVREPFQAIQGITDAGSIFLGNYSPVAAGDYASGTNHVLPTSGYARRFSGLNVDHFFKKISIQSISADGLRLLEPTITSLAEAEGLKAHAESVKRRLALDR